MSLARRAPTHYDVLDVDPRAPVEVIHSAWRGMASLVHPDAALAHSDPEEYADRELMMKTVNAAWEVLGDTVMRARYDSSIGLDRPLTRLFLRLRRGARAAGRPREAEPLKLHRPSLLSRPPLLAEAQTLAHFAWGTRVGQWLLLLGIVALAQLASVGLVESTRGPLLLAIVVLSAVVLARGGEPTPAADAAHASVALGHWGYRKTTRLARALGRELVAVIVARQSPPRTPPANGR